MDMMHPTRTHTEVIATWQHTSDPACRYCGQDEEAIDGEYRTRWYGLPAHERMGGREPIYRPCTWCRATGVDPYPDDPTAVR